MSDLGDLIGQAQLGEQPATVTVDVYARAEIERLRAELAGLRDRLNVRAADLAARDTGEPAEPSQVGIDVGSATPDDLRGEVHRLDLRLRWAYTHYDDQVTVNLMAAYGLTDQRDEARAEVERLRRRIAEAVHEAERDQAEARAELASARDSLVARDRALVRARAQIGELIAQATSRHGTTDEIRNLISDLTDPDHEGEPQ